MSSRFLLQLLGFWLLLSQPCRARVTEEWMDQVIQVCGGGYARAWIEICRASTGRLALRQEEAAPPPSRPTTETVASFILKDAEPFDMMLKCLPDLSEEPKAAVSKGLTSLPELLHYAPALSDSGVSLEGFKKTSHNTQGDAKDNSPPGLKYLLSDIPSWRTRHSGCC